MFKIGITIPYASVNYSGGLNVQCRMWKHGLESLGHKVDLLTPWEKFPYEEYDYVIIVGTGKILLDYIHLFKQFSNIKLISAPVFDPNETPLWKFRLKCKYFGCAKLHIQNNLHDYYCARKDFVLFLARSEFERKYIVHSLGLTPDKVIIVPISVRYCEQPLVDFSKKEEFCLHVSRLASYSKNVTRLIQAAKKYGFQLRLAGTLNGEKERQWLENQIGDSKNITYLGWLSEDELKKEYRKAKVFALPSIIEGVGMVALEAAIYGCEICLTNLGGPKEYYGGRAVLVNPYDVNSIGKGVLEAMNHKNAQPELGQYIIKKYSVESCMKILCESISD